jgi:NAD(P)-dependent dehydrogenase (short-subunit alcohol dehydrogenase family)
MPQTFTGKIVLVAGGTGGLGRGVSLAFLAEGATVVVTYRNEAELDALRGAAGANASRLAGHSLDVLDEAAVKAFVESIVAQYGRLDAMVNAVGGWSAGKPLWEMDGKALDQMLALNLKSGYMLARAVVPAMLKRGAGTIVNVAATAAFNHMPSAAEYVASKAAAVAMIDSLAADLKGSGVRANSILPSIIDTEANRRAMPDADHAQWPKPEEIARVILFLCSDDAKLVHGAAIPV